MTTQFLGKTLETTAQDKADLAALINSAPRHETFFMHQALENFEHFGGWWMGIRPAAGGPLEAVSCIEATFATMYATNTAAATALGNNLARESRGARDGREHHIFGARIQVLETRHSSAEVASAAYNLG